MDRDGTDKGRLIIWGQTAEDREGQRNSERYRTQGVMWVYCEIKCSKNLFWQTWSYYVKWPSAAPCGAALATNQNSKKHVS